ncbi:CLUMA_CG005110, isoform A, partial [Clunio marinus]
FFYQLIFCNFSHKIVKYFTIKLRYLKTKVPKNNFKDVNSDQMNISLFNIKKSLKLANIAFDDGYTNLKTNCPVCEGEENSSDIYINKTTGQFLCPKCRYGAKFGLIEKFFTTSRSSKTVNELKTYQKLFLTAKEQYQKENDFIFHSYEQEFQVVTSNMTNDIFTYFEFDEKVPKDSLLSLNARYDSVGKRLLFPLTDILGQIVGCKILSKDETGNNFTTETTFPDLLCSGFVIHNNEKITKNSKDKDQMPHKAIIVLNILDILALMSTKINATFICLPYGLKFLPQECLPALDRYDELVLWFNYNTAGWDIARNFAKKLDEKRCNFVRPTNAHPTPYKALISNIDIKGILNKSQPILHKAITTFSSLKQDVLSDLQNIDKVQGVKWKRYPTLNKYLKGHRKGELTILTGPTGCGKTTFMSDYSLDLAIQGVNTLWGSFEIRNTRLASTLLRQFAGKPLLDVPSDENMLEFEHYANAFEMLPIYFMTFHGEQQIKNVMEAIEHATYVHDVNHVIIDNVQFMMGISEEAKHIDRFWKQDAIIAAFRTFATRKNCHVTLVIHPRKEKESDDLTTSSIFGGAKATQEADNVLIIQDKRLTSVRGKKYLQIAKNRYSGDLGIMPLEFDKQSLSYAQKIKKKLESSDQQTKSEMESSQNESDEIKVL